MSTSSRSTPGKLVRSDPRGFLAEYEHGAILDEIQNVPELLSYLQADVVLRRNRARRAEYEGK